MIEWGPFSRTRILLTVLTFVFIDFINFYFFTRHERRIILENRTPFQLRFGSSRFVMLLKLCGMSYWSVKCVVKTDFFMDTWIWDSSWYKSFIQRANFLTSSGNPRPTPMFYPKMPNCKKIPETHLLDTFLSNGFLSSYTWFYWIWTKNYRVMALKWECVLKFATFISWKIIFFNISVQMFYNTICSPVFDISKMRFI